MRHLLLIDNSIKDLAVFQGCINTNTDSIVFDFATDTLASLQTKLNAFRRQRKFQHVGIVQENGPANKFLNLVENQVFVQWIVEKTKCIALDLFTCNIMKDTKWRKTIKMIQTSFPQIALGASDDVTGNNNSGGDWIAETGGTDLKTIYLTDAIKDYKGTFGLDGEYTIIVDGSGGCYVMGDNNYGQLGLGIGKVFNSISPAERLTISGKHISNVQLGNDHSVFLCSDGTVYCCGYNSYGQLGTENNNNYYIPTAIDLDNISAIACGSSHTLFLRNNGTVCACGYNGNGELGLGNNSDTNIPTQIPDLSNVTAIAAGDGFSMFLCEDGFIYGCGDNGNGQLGIGNTNYPYPIVPTQVVSTNFSSTVTSIACGGDYTLFLCSDGTVYGTGENGSGQLGIDGDSEYDVPTKIDENNQYFSSGVGMIFCGYYNSFFVCIDGNVYGCGYNDYGELGIGNDYEQYTPTMIEFFNNNNKIINYIQCSSYFTTFVCSDKSVYVCGGNDYCQLGDGSFLYITTPTLLSFSKTITALSIGYDHGLFLCSDGTVYSCGNTTNGALGLGNGVNEVSELTQITDLSNISKIAICAQNGGASIFLHTNGTVYSCGGNSNGQLGLGNTDNYYTPTQIPDLSNIVDITCGSYHSMFLDSSGNVYGCGSNNNYQLGLGDNNNRYSPTLLTDISNVSHFASGSAHTLLISNGYAYSCGYNQQYQLGFNDNSQRTVPTLISDLSNVTYVACGAYFSFMVCSNGTVYGCGENSSSQLGIGYSNQYSFTLMQITDLSNISTVSCGSSHSLFLDGSGNIYGCGSTSNGQLGLPTTDDEYNNTYTFPTQITVGSNKVVSQIFAGISQSAFLCNDNTLYVSGENGYSHSFGLKYIDQYDLPTLATFNATIAANLVVPCFGEGTEILSIVGEEETYIPVEKLVPGSIVKTYLHGPQVVKKISKGSLLNNSDDPKKCMFKMEKSGNMTADLCLTGGHALLKSVPPKGLRFKIDDQYLHFVENLPEFKKMEARKYNHYNFCFENGGNKDLRYGVWANGVLCETPSEKQLESFE